MPQSLSLSKSIAFSTAVTEDFETLLAIRIEAMRESLERIGRFDAVRARERFLSGYSPEHTRHIELSGERVGFFTLRPLGAELLLDHLYVRPGYQSKGIGSAVLTEIFAQADRSGLPVRVGALRESESNRFYLQHGFELVGHTEYDNYYVRLAKNAL
jgi:GNAT superfamily N-acetyltransferase